MNYIVQDINTMNIQGNADPVTTLINKLSSGEDLKVKIQTETDNVFLKDYKKLLLQSLRIDTHTTSPNLPKFEKIFNIFLNRRSPNFPNQDQKCLMEKMKSVPTYTVVNGNNEIIMASPRKIKKEGSIVWLREKYSELFSWSNDEGPVSVALFFMNKEDAESYMHEICKKEPRESESLGLKVKIVGLDKFYRFNRTSPPKVQARLVADFHEIEIVLKQCIGKFFYNMNPKQRYSKTWFQGSPIYILRLTHSSGKNLLSAYTFHTNSEKKVVFFSKEDAIRAWKVFRLKYPELQSKSEPNLEIYNFESLINDLENSNTKNLMDICLVPPYESYQNSKVSLKRNEKLNYSKLETYTYQAQLRLNSFKRFYKGIVWLLTSDTLPSEENSW